MDGPNTRSKIDHLLHKSCHCDFDMHTTADLVSSETASLRVEKFSLTVFLKFTVFQTFVSLAKIWCLFSNFKTNFQNIGHFVQ